jgi:hypothetical protein
MRSERPSRHTPLSAPLVPCACRFNYPRLGASRGVGNACGSGSSSWNSNVLRESACEVSRVRAAIRGVLILHALSTGEPLAVMESSYLTPLRTGLAGALGCDVLALAGATRVAIIGAGVHGRAQLSALRLVRPIESVRVLDTSPEAIERFRRDPACAGLEVTSATSLEDVLDNVHIAIAARGEPAFSVSPSSTRGPPHHRAWRGSTREVRSRGGRVGEGVGCCGRQELAVQMGAIGGQVWAWNRYTPDWER